jgi:hypothetical protein
MLGPSNCTVALAERIKTNIPVHFLKGQSTEKMCEIMPWELIFDLNLCLPTVFFIF